MIILPMIILVFILPDNPALCQGLPPGKDTILPLNDSRVNNRLDLLKMRTLAPKHLIRNQPIELELVMETKNEVAEITGYVQLEIYDLKNNQSVDGWFRNIFPLQYFSILPSHHTSLKFPIQVPGTFEGSAGFHFLAYNLQKKLIGESFLELESKE